MIKKQYQLFILFLSLFIMVLCPAPALAAPYISINKNQSSTKVRKVDLYLEGPSNTQMMMISNLADFSDAVWVPYQTYKLWYLQPGASNKAVYVKFASTNGMISSIYSDSIELNPQINMSVGFKVNNGATETNNRIVNLKISWSPGVEEMRISNTSDFGLSDWIAIDDDISWVLSSGSGSKKIRVQFRDSNGTVKTIFQNIKYNQPANYISEGTLLKGVSTAVYYLGYDGKIHPFFNSAIYNSWYPNFNNILHVSNSKLKQYQVGKPVCVRPGTWIVKFTASDRMYSVEPGCSLREIRSQIEAQIIYGKNWKKRVIVLDSILLGYYKKLDWAGLGSTANDQDKDGLEENMEDDYGTSDLNSDSDNDGLSDYEEVNFWFTDPAVADTDKDGKKDGKEILAGTSPLGPGKLGSISSGTYEFPLGALIRGKASGDLYYRNYDGKYLKVNSDAFNSNRFQNKFIIQQAYDIPFSTNGNLKNSTSAVTLPQVMTSGGSLVNL